MKHSIKLAGFGLVLFCSLLCPSAPAQAQAAAGARSLTAAATPAGVEVCWLYFCCNGFSCHMTI